MTFDNKKNTVSMARLIAAVVFGVINLAVCVSAMVWGLNNLHAEVMVIHGLTAVSVTTGIAGLYMLGSAYDLWQKRGIVRL